MVTMNKMHVGRSGRHQREATNVGTSPEAALYYTLYSIIRYYTMLYYSIPRSVPATARPRPAAARPRRCREVWGAATPPSRGSRGQRRLGTLNYAVKCKISILGVVKLHTTQLSWDETIVRKLYTTTGLSTVGGYSGVTCWDSDKHIHMIVIAIVALIIPVAYLAGRVLAREGMFCLRCEPQLRLKNSWICRLSQSSKPTFSSVSFHGRTTDASGAN